MRPNITGESPVIEDREITDGGLYFNPAAYSRTPPFTFGNAARTIGEIRNPGGRNLDLLLEKRIATGGNTDLSIRLEAFNAFNYVQYGGPGHQHRARDIRTDLLHAGEHAAPDSARRTVHVLMRAHDPRRHVPDRRVASRRLRLRG